MTRSNPHRSAATQIFVGALAAAVLAFAPAAAFAQRGGGGGGHMGGGGGGHFGGGSVVGGSHPTAPAHSASKPSTKSAPATLSRSPIVVSGRRDSVSTSGAAGHASLFGPPATSGPAAGLAIHSEPAAPRTTVIGFPPSQSHAWVSTPTRSGPMSFSGQGHDIWQDSSSRGSNNVVTNPPATTNRSLFNATTRPPSTIIRPMPPHIGFLPTRPPVIFVPVYGYFGYGYGFSCDPFFGFNYAFGCNGFGYGYGYGGGYGAYYGSGYGYNSGYDDSSNSVETSPDEGYGPYSSPNLSQDNWSAPANGDASSSDTGSSNGVTAAPSDATPAPAPAATTIWLKDGTSYEVMSYWLDAGKLHYITNYGGENSIDMSQLDLQRTVDENAFRGVNFTLRPAPATPAPSAAPSAAPDATPTPQQ